MKRCYSALKMHEFNNLNVLKADHHFDKINIETRQTDKMTENQQHAFVKEYFFKHEHN